MGLFTKKTLEQKADAKRKRDEYVSAFVQGINESRATKASGKVSNAIECPYCHVTDQVRTKSVKAKKGISGGKATGAVLTGGVSILATGLSRKEHETVLTCGNCHMTWTI